LTSNNDIEKIQINCAKRAIRIHDQISASLYTGSHKLESGFGNGDCVLLDFNNLFFAISDSTDRWPDASLNFIFRLVEELEKQKTPVTGEEWLDIVNGLYATQKYLYRATFSGIALGRYQKDRIATIVHGGDSIILIVNKERKEIRYMTDADMNFMKMPAFSRSLEILLQLSAFIHLLNISESLI